MQIDMMNQQADESEDEMERLRNERDAEVGCGKEARVVVVPCGGCRCPFSKFHPLFIRLRMRMCAAYGVQGSSQAVKG